ncbi:MAG: DnaD domain protein [Chloroflexi bacterium]|nr:DnaD domain protein [Chloroflexota bacterium]
MNTFPGFPGGKVKFTSIPNAFFSELLPLIDNLAELKVTLHIFWLLTQRQGSTPYVTLQGLLGDGTLLRGLQGQASSPQEALRNGLEQATARGTLLCLVQAEGENRVYFLNSELGRRAWEKAQLGELRLPTGGPLIKPATPVSRPNIFVLYEQNIGLLQPMIAEELQEAEKAYPQNWIEDAFRIAAERNVRNWKYVRRILERWAAEGKDEGEGKVREKTWYTEEEYKKLIKH